MQFRDLFNKIIKGDCAKVLAVFPDECIDLVVTSPPYDDLRDYRGYTFDFQEITKQLFRVMKIGGVVVWVVNDSTKNGSETGNSFRQALYFIDVGFRLHDTMIFAKKNPMPGKQLNRYKQQFEYMFVFSKNAPKTFNPFMRRNKSAGQIVGEKATGNRSQDGTLNVFHQIGKPIKEFAVSYNIWFYGVTASKTTVFHPAVFPLALVEDHIYSWSNEEDIVLDPFFGSGTTGAAAKSLKRNYIGIEISEEYCALARERIDNYHGSCDEIVKSILARKRIMDDAQTQLG